MGRKIGMDVHRDFAQLAMVEDGLLKDAGRSAVVRRNCGPGPQRCARTTRSPWRPPATRRRSHWATQCARNLLMSLDDTRTAGIRYLIRDNAGYFTEGFD
ncbi:hypothetical protein ACFYYV_48785, partial [Streptomyces sp. NPDC001978]